jgi:hypothetical protein
MDAYSNFLSDESDIFGQPIQPYRFEPEESEPEDAPNDEETDVGERAIDPDDSNMDIRLRNKKW